MHTNNNTCSKIREFFLKSQGTFLLFSKKKQKKTGEASPTSSIANKFNNFFIDIGPELSKEIPRPAKSFES